MPSVKDATRYITIKWERLEDNGTGNDVFLEAEKSKCWLRVEMDGWGKLGGLPLPLWLALLGGNRCSVLAGSGFNGRLW